MANVSIENIDKNFGLTLRSAYGVTITLNIHNISSSDVTGLTKESLDISDSTRAQYLDSGFSSTPAILAAIHHKLYNSTATQWQYNYEYHVMLSREERDCVDNILVELAPSIENWKNQLG
jgi:hypothetical protein